jgi:hypothetical protein
LRMGNPSPSASASLFRSLHEQLAVNQSQKSHHRSTSPFDGELSVSPDHIARLNTMIILTLSLRSMMARRSGPECLPGSRKKLVLNQAT